MKTQLVVIRSTKNEPLQHAVAQSLADLDVATALKSDTRVYLKPNLAYPQHKPGVTTSPQFLRAVISGLRQYTANITIVESDGGSLAWTALEAFAGHDIPAICSEFGVRAMGLSQERVVHARTTVAGREIDVPLPAPLLEDCDFFITLPVPKVHVMTGVSLGFKNQWGCLPDPKRVKYHPRFPEMVIATNKLLGTRLAMFDGTYFLNRSGPIDGDAVAKDLIIAGEVGLATCACCELMQVDPMAVRHLRLAIREGLMPKYLLPEQVIGDLSEHAQTFCLKRGAVDIAALAVFRSAIATKLIYDSRAAKPIHDLLYAIKGRPRDFAPQW